MDDRLIHIVFILACVALALELMVTYRGRETYKKHYRRIWILLVIAVLFGYGVYYRAVDKAKTNARYDKGHEGGKVVTQIRYVDSDNNDNFYDDGYSDGEAEGYEKGYEAGKWDGYEEGEEMGYYNGYEDGKKDGYNDGYEYGYSEGELNVMQTYDNIGKYW